MLPSFESDLQELERRAKGIDTDTLVGALFALLRGHPQERTVTLQLVEARMDEQTRLATFRLMRSEERRVGKEC